MSYAAQIKKIKDLARYASIFRDDIKFLIFEIEKRDKVIKIISDAVKMRLTQNQLEKKLEIGRAEFLKTYESENSKSANPPKPNLKRMSIKGSLDIDELVDKAWAEIPDKEDYRHKARVFVANMKDFDIEMDVNIDTGEWELVSCSYGKQRAYVRFD